MALTRRSASPSARASRLSSSAYAWQLATSRASRFLSPRSLPICACPVQRSYAGSTGCKVGVLIDRRGRRYYLHEKTLNSLIGMRSYQQVRRILSNATEELFVFDTFAG